MATVAVTAQIGSPTVPTASRGYWATVLVRLRRDKMTMVCGGILLLILLAAIFAPFVAPADPYKTSMLRRLLPVFSPNHVLGTDELGRDMLSRLIYGGAAVAVHGPRRRCSAPSSSAPPLGVIAGYAGGRINMVIMRVIDVFYAFPSVLLAIAISGGLGAGVINSLVSAHHRLHPADRRVAEIRDHQRALARLRRCRARQRRRGLHRHPRAMCWATCWARSSSTRRRSSASAMILASGLSLPRPRHQAARRPNGA